MYTSLDPQRPLKGLLTAGAIQQLVPYIENSLQKAPGPKLEPLEPIDVPPVRTYSLMPLTGRIICRQHMGEDAGMESHSCYHASSAFLLAALSTD